MLLAIDIGNTNVKFGLYEGGWKEVWRLRTTDETQEKLTRALNKYLGDHTIESAVISSVVPFFTPIVKDQVIKKTGVRPYIVTSESYKNLPIGVIRAEQIGTDLVADALAAYDMFNADCLVVDFGTALTFTLVNDKKIQGVNIVPGIKTSLQALTSKAAKLHEIPLELPRSVIGTDTTTAIQSGILWGYVGLVEKMIERISNETGKDLKVVATGGLSHVLSALESQFDAVNKNLTLDGVRLIHAYN